MNSNKLTEKLKHLPQKPGVYFHKNQSGEIIYVGKATVLRNRVRQYFQASKNRDPKTEVLIQEIADTDWQVVDSELEALFLEAELIRRYMPKYNILLRDDKSLSYVRINFKDKYPFVSYTRRPIDDGAEYFGPFYSMHSIKKAMRYLRKIFPYSTHHYLPNKACLHFHLGLCPGPETGDLDEKAYRSDLKKIVRIIRGQRKSLISELAKEMTKLADEAKFEQAASKRNQINALTNMGNLIIFSDKEFRDISKDYALAELTDLLGLKKPPKRIEGFDISHMSGTDTVASMVVFVNGVPDKSNYRKFKSRLPGNDDFLHMHEAITRRFSDTNIKKWGLPDLLLIDGGKGQLDSAIKVLKIKNLAIPIISLAKKFEEVVVCNNWQQIKLDTNQVTKLNGSIKKSDNFTIVNLPKNTNASKLLQRIRDESHRFAVSYHSVLKTKRQTRSILDEMPGIGPKTKKNLIKTFGSTKNVLFASEKDLAKVVGPKRAKIILQRTTD